MFICVFQAPRRPPKEGKQKHLFTPLLSRRDLEGGSVLGAMIPLEMALHSNRCRGQLVRGALSLCVIVCFCDRRAHDAESERCKARRADMSHFQERGAPLLLFFFSFARDGCALLRVTCGSRYCLPEAGKAGNPVTVAWLTCNALEYPLPPSLPPARFCFVCCL